MAVSLTFHSEKQLRRVAPTKNQKLNLEVLITQSSSADMEK